MILWTHNDFLCSHGRSRLIRASSLVTKTARRIKLKIVIGDCYCGVEVNSWCRRRRDWNFTPSFDRASVGRSAIAVKTCDDHALRQSGFVSPDLIAVAG